MWLALIQKRSAESTQRRLYLLKKIVVATETHQVGKIWSYDQEEGCPIHPNKAVCEALYQKSIHGQCVPLYRKFDKPSLIRWKRIPEVNFCKTLRKWGLKMLSNRLDSTDSSQWKSTCHTGSRFARHLENIPQVTTKARWECCRIERLVSVDVDSSHRKSICKTLKTYTVTSRVESIRL